MNVILSLIVLTTASTTLLSAATDHSALAGTFVNTKFMETAQKTRSIPEALKQLRPEEQLLLRIVEAGADSLDVRFARTFTAGRSARQSTREVPGMGTQRYIDILGVQWVFTNDQPQYRYVALHPTGKDSASKPDVYARIPTKNQDLDFIVSRVLNKILVTGTYTAPDGTTASFTKDQKATMGKRAFEYTLAYDHAKERVVMTTAEKSYFVVSWTSGSLALQPCTRTGEPQRKPPTILTPEHSTGQR